MASEMTLQDYMERTGKSRREIASMMQLTYYAITHMLQGSKIVMVRVENGGETLARDHRTGWIVGPQQPEAAQLIRDRSKKRAKKQ